MNNEIDEIRYQIYKLLVSIPIEHRNKYCDLFNNLPENPTKEQWTNVYNILAEAVKQNHWTYR